ncbi:MAG: class I SAM-dependent methyltransferase [Nitrospinaceae bacterium]|jgi:ubiquinone/menaquinone biosynthesis C-methylase UbiE|nr:class I SAM-dependent methyltransferase [Nitrospinaceae bacterium]
MPSSWPLPENDPWSTPFAQLLMHHLELHPGDTVLDIAAGGGIPAFHMAECVGPEGRVLAVDIHQAQVLRAKSVQGPHLPWLQFEVGDMRFLPPTLSPVNRITGNLSFMFFRPNRFEALKNLLRFLKPGGQIVLTFPSLGTFDSLWNYVGEEMQRRGLLKEREALNEYLQERPSSDHARQWLQELGLDRVEVTEWPLEIFTGPGQEFLQHPLLRGGFLDDIYECFEDQKLAHEFMADVSQNIDCFTPLFAQRCAMSGFLPV